MCVRMYVYTPMYCSLSQSPRDLRFNACSGMHACMHVSNNSCSRTDVHAYDLVSIMISVYMYVHTYICKQTHADLLCCPSLEDI